MNHYLSLAASILTTTPLSSLMTQLNIQLTQVFTFFHTFECLSQKLSKVLLKKS